MHVQVNGDRGAAGEHLEGGLEATLGQDRGVDAARDLAHLVQRAVEPGGQAVQLGHEIATPGWHRRPHRAHPQGEGDQLLLGAVVQVPLDTSARLVRSGDDPRPRRGELGVQLGVVQGDSELAGDELDGIEPPGGERAADEPVFQQQHGTQYAPAEDGQGQQ